MSICSTTPSRIPFGSQESAADVDRVMSFRKWCALTGVSPATGRRIISAGEGPTVIQLGARRIGIRYSDHRAWLESRARTPAADHVRAR
jgi:predicted DNA-binding transcriptional regulator AlpA